MGRDKNGQRYVIIIAMREDIDIFLELVAKEKGYSRNTVVAYQNDLNQLAAYIEAEKAKGIVASIDQILKSYSLYLREKKYSMATVARKTAAAKSFFKFMVDSGKLKDDLTKNLISPHVKRRSPDFLSNSEYQLLLAEPAKLSTPEAKRDVIMLELLYATGLRVSELVSLNVKDIDLERTCVHCVYGGSKRDVPLDHHTSQLIKKFIGNDRLDLLFNENEQALFLNLRGQRLTRQGLWQIIKNYAAKADLSSKVTPEALRHSFAVRKLQSGTDIHSIKELLGHAYISSTRVYEQPRLRTR